MLDGREVGRWARFCDMAERLRPRRVGGEALHAGEAGPGLAEDNQRVASSGVQSRIRGGFPRVAIASRPPADSFSGHWQRELPLANRATSGRGASSQ